MLLNPRWWIFFKKEFIILFLFVILRCYYYLKIFSVQIVNNVGHSPNNFLFYEIHSKKTSKLSSSKVNRSKSTCLSLSQSPYSSFFSTNKISPVKTKDLDLKVCSQEWKRNFIINLAAMLINFFKKKTNIDQFKTIKYVQTIVSIPIINTILLKYE